MCLLFLPSADNVRKGKKYLCFPETSVLNLFQSLSARLRIKYRILCL